MLSHTGISPQRRRERGATLVMVAGGLVFFIVCCAFAIDLCAAYVARNEAQRIADAAALAGATVFVDEGCTTAGTLSTQCETDATTQAGAVAGQNAIFGTTATVANTDFTGSRQYEPMITVTVNGTSPTWFIKVFSSTFASGIPVSAKATAEAYSPEGTSAAVGEACLKPFLVPNCDAGHPVAGTDSRANTVCPTTTGGTCTSGSANCQSYFFYPTTSGGHNQGDIVNNSLCTSWTTAAANSPTAGVCNSGGAVGEPWQLHDNAVPSQWYELQFGNEGNLGNDPSGSILRQAIEQCSFQIVSCGSPFNTDVGVKQGPTDQGVDCFINSGIVPSPTTVCTGGGKDGPGNGQDTICDPVVQGCTHNSAPPFYITGGSNNQNGLAGQIFDMTSGSSSVASVAVYDGHALVSGNSSGCPNGTDCVTVVGFMQLFVVDAQPPGNNGDGSPPPGFPSVGGTVDTIIMSIGGCGNSSSSTSPPVTTQGGSFVPIRLIHNP